MSEYNVTENILKCVKQKYSVGNRGLYTKEIAQQDA